MQLGASLLPRGIDDRDVDLRKDVDDHAHERHKVDGLVDRKVTGIPPQPRSLPIKRSADRMDSQRPRLRDERIA